MEKDQGYMAEGKPAWNSCSLGMEMPTNELNCVWSCFLNSIWDNSTDQRYPFESALSSMVCSPAASNAGSCNFPGSGDNVMKRELVRKLGNMCNTGDNSPQSFIKPNNNSCPLNSPPKLNLSMVDLQMRGSLKFPSLVPDPGFSERAARFSCVGVTEAEFPQRCVPTMDSVKVSRVSTNQSVNLGGSQVNVTDNNKSLPQDGNSCSDTRNGRLWRCSSPENGDSKEESSISKQISGVDSSIKGQNNANSRKRKLIYRGKAKETSSLAPADAKIAEANDESNAKRSKQQNGDAKAANHGIQKKNKETPEVLEHPKDYIHVRARRGQATDSHSLAERVRREKISERMKLLQDLVPGCSKMTGKAVMLDEIINYVQSLQHQVEFLSMKLATVNPRMNVNMEALLSKDMFQSHGSLPHSLYSMDSSAPTVGFGYQPQQGLRVNTGISNNTEIRFSMNPLSAALHKTQGLLPPPVDSSTLANPQIGWFSDDDLQRIVQIGFGQNQPQSYQSKHNPKRIRHQHA